MDGIAGVAISIGKGVLLKELRKHGRKLTDKDANTTGKDDAGGRSLLAMADALDVIEFTDNPTSLMNIGKALEAAGKQIQAEASKV